MSKPSPQTCQFCSAKLKETDPIVCFQFEGPKTVVYHEECYDLYVKQYNRYRKVLQMINSGEFNLILNEGTKSEIASISVPDQQEENCICPICLYNVADMVLLPCGHRLCNECLLDWRRKTICKKQSGTKCCFCRRFIEKSVPYATLKQEQKL